MSNSIQDCINLTFVIKIQISVVNFIRCHYNPGWYSRKFLDPRNKNKHKQKRFYMKFAIVQNFFAMTATSLMSFDLRIINPKSLPAKYM